MIFSDIYNTPLDPYKIYFHNTMQDVYASIFSKQQLLSYRNAHYNSTKEPLNLTFFKLS